MLAGWDAAPAGGDGRTPAPGRPGKPTGGHYDPSARSSLDWDWRQCLVPGSADPAPVSLAKAGGAKPRWSAGSRPHPSQEDAATERLVRRLALHPLDLFEGHEKEDGVPGASKKYGR